MVCLLCEEIQCWNSSLMAWLIVLNMGQKRMEGGRFYVEENRLSFYETLNESLDKLKSQTGCVCDGPNL